MANLAPARGASGPRLTRRASYLLLALASLTACGRKGDLYLPEGRTPAPTAEEGDRLPDRTEEPDNLEER
jgi:predicted small lipoprotein YifL